MFPVFIKVTPRNRGSVPATARPNEYWGGHYVSPGRNRPARGQGGRQEGPVGGGGGLIVTELYFRHFNFYILKESNLKTITIAEYDEIFSKYVIISFHPFWWGIERGCRYGDWPVEEAPGRAEIGRASWTYLHATAAYYPVEPTKEEQVGWLCFFQYCEMIWVSFQVACAVCDKYI